MDVLVGGRVENGRGDETKRAVVNVGNVNGFCVIVTTGFVTVDLCVLKIPVVGSGVLLNVVPVIEKNFI